MNPTEGPADKRTNAESQRTERNPNKDNNLVTLANSHINEVIAVVLD